MKETKRLQTKRGPSGEPESHARCGSALYQIGSSPQLELWENGTLAHSRAAHGKVDLTRWCVDVTSCMQPPRGLRGLSKTGKWGRRGRRRDAQVRHWQALPRPNPDVTRLTGLSCSCFAA